MGLCELFDKKPSPEFTEIYWSVLKDRLSLEQFKSACSKAAASAKFMPKPAELLEAVGLAGAKAMAARVAEAWDAVRGAMDRHDYTTSVDFGTLVNAVIRTMGGWQELCEKTVPELVWVRKDFERLYEALAEKPLDQLNGSYHLGAFKGTPVPIAIGGVAPPRQIAGEVPRTAAVVRELAEAKS